MRQDFLSDQWLSPHCQGQGLIPSYWRRSPEDWALSGSLPLVCIFLSPHTRTFAPEEGSAEASGAHVQTEVHVLPVQANVALLRCNLVCKFPLSLTANRCPLPLFLPSPSHCCGVTSQGWQNPHGLSAHVWRLAVVEQSLSEIQAAFGTLPEEVPTMAAATLPGLCPETRQLLHPMVESFPQSSCSRSSTALCHGVSGARAFA